MIKNKDDDNSRTKTHHDIALKNRIKIKIEDKGLFLLKNFIENVETSMSLIWYNNNNVSIVL